MRISTSAERPTVSIQNGRPICLPISSDKAWSSSEKNGFGPGGGRSVTGRKSTTRPSFSCAMRRIGWIVLDLAAQPIDLHVDRAFTGIAAIAGECQPRHGLAGRSSEQPQHLALAIGEVNDLLAALELAARDVEAELAEAHRFDRW